MTQVEVVSEFMEDLVGLLSLPCNSHPDVVPTELTLCSPEVGILSGQRGGFDGEPMLRLRYLSTRAAVRPGQKVFTTGRGGVFEANVLLGEIESVEIGALDSEALVRPSVNFADLGAVFVVLEP